LKSPQFGEEGMGNTDLIDAYNAGLNGTDLSRETRDNAAAGGYLDSIEAMYNAGRQDAKTQSTGDGTEDDLSAEAAEKEKILQNDIDNLENMGYTKSNSAESTDTVDELIQYTDTANNYEASNTSSGASDSTASGKTYKITDDEKELNYMMDMLFMNGAGSSTDPSIQMAYEWVSNPDNKGKAIPDEIKDAFYKFMSSVTEDQIVRSNRIAVGKDDELGLAGKIYEAKAANRKSTDNASQYYPEANTSAPVSTSLGDYAASTGKNNQESYSWGEAGRFALGETLKSNPDIFGERSSFLYEAYQAGLSGIDLTKELVTNARAGGFLDEIMKMYIAGGTDAKIASGDNSSQETTVGSTVESQKLDADAIVDNKIVISDVSLFDEYGEKTQCVVYACKRAREYWGIEDNEENSFGIHTAVEGFGDAEFLDVYHGADMQTLIDMPNHSVAFLAQLKLIKEDMRFLSKGKTTNIFISVNAILVKRPMDSFNE